MKFESVGELRYSDSGWLVLTVPQSIILYYRHWVQKFIWRKTSPPYHKGHITIIAGKYENATKHPAWGKYHKQKIKFEYSNKIMSNKEGYYWLPISCPKLAEIRLELGLKPQPYWPYHATVCFDQN